MKWLLSKPQVDLIDKFRGINYGGLLVADDLLLSNLAIDSPVVLGANVKGTVTFENVTAQDFSLYGNIEKSIIINGGHFNLLTIGTTISQNLLIAGLTAGLGDFSHAHIEGNLVILAGQFLGVSDRKGYRYIGTDGVALLASHITCKGDVAMLDVQSIGAFLFDDAKVGGSFIVRGGREKTVTRPEDSSGKKARSDSTVLDLRGAVITKDVIIGGTSGAGSNLQIDGVVDMSDAQMQSLAFRGAFSGTGETGLVADRTNIAGLFEWTPERLTSRSELKLYDAKAAQFYAAQPWPAPGELLIDGFRYDEIYFQQDPLDWVHLQDHYSPLPYDQLAKVFRDRGAANDARRAMFAKYDDLLARGRVNPVERIIGSLLRFAVGYGYYPMRAASRIGLLILIAIGVSSRGKRAQLFVPTEASAAEEFLYSGNLPKHYPRFNNVVYSIEILLPFLSLGQARYWMPNSQAGVAGQSLQWCLWVLTIATYLLFVLFVTSLAPDGSASLNAVWTG